MSAEIDIKKVSPLDSLETAPFDLVQIKPLASKMQWEAGLAIQPQNHR
jgi:hypothetical protein